MRKQSKQKAFCTGLLNLVCILQDMNFLQLFAKIGVINVIAFLRLVYSLITIFVDLQSFENYV